MRLLHALQRHRHVGVAVILAVEIEHFAGQAEQQDLQRLGVALARFHMTDRETAEFIGRLAAADAKLEASAAKLVKHADFFDEPQRLVHRQHIDHWTETQPLGALRDRR